jgi:quinol monooxygenase YgiN
MKASTTLSLLSKVLVITLASLMLNTTYAKERNLISMEKEILFLMTSHDKKGNTGGATGNGPEVALLTRYDVKKGYKKKFRKLIRKYVKRANTQESNIMTEGYYEEENPSVLWTIERWNDQSAMERFRKGSKLKLLKLLSAHKLTVTPRIIYVKDLEPISKNEWRKPAAKEDKPITIMLFIDSKAGTEDEFKATYHAAMPKFRSEPGVINYQLSQLKDDSTQFVTYEKFRNEEAFQYHLKFPPIQPVIDYLNNSIKQQPFQAGLHRLIEFAPVKR